MPCAFIEHYMNGCLFIFTYAELLITATDIELLGLANNKRNRVKIPNEAELKHIRVQYAFLAESLLLSKLFESNQIAEMFNRNP